MIKKEPDPEISPIPEVYRFVIGLFALWEDEDGNKESIHFIRICQIADDLESPDTVRVQEILSQDKFPNSQEIEYVALTLAQRAKELDWDLDW